MTREVVHGDIFATVRAVGFLAQMDALDVVIEQLLGLELLLAVGALVVPDLLVEILDVVIEIFVFLVADVTRGGLRKMNLLDVVLQRILGDKLLLAERTLRNLVVTMLLEDVPPEVAHGEGLIAQLALDLLPVLGQDVLVQGRHLLPADVARLLHPLRPGLHVLAPVGLGVQLGEDGGVVHGAVLLHGGAQGRVIAVPVSEDGGAVRESVAVRQDCGSDRKIVEAVRIIGVGLHGLEDEDTVLLDDLLHLGVGRQLGDALHTGAFQGAQDSLSAAIRIKTLHLLSISSLVIAHEHFILYRLVFVRHFGNSSF